MLSYMIDLMNIRILPIVISSLSLVIFIAEAYGRPSIENGESDSFCKTLPRTFITKSLKSQKKARFHTVNAVFGSLWEKGNISPKSYENDNIDKDVVSNALSKRVPWFAASISDLRTEMIRPVTRSIKRNSGDTVPKSFFSSLAPVHDPEHIFSFWSLEKEFHRKVKEKQAPLSVLQEEFRLDVADDLLLCLKNRELRQLDLSFYARKFFDEESILADKFDPIFGQKHFDPILNDVLADFLSYSHEKSERGSKKEGSKTATPPQPPVEFADAPLHNQTLSASSQVLKLLPREGGAQELLISPSFAAAEKIAPPGEDQDKSQFYNSAQNRSTQSHDFLHQEEKASKTSGLVAKAKRWFKTAADVLFDVASYTISAVCDSFGNPAYYGWGL